MRERGQRHRVVCGVEHQTKESDGTIQDPKASDNNGHVDERRGKVGLVNGKGDNSDHPERDVDDVKQFIIPGANEDGGNGNENKS